jgi:hypothetical protein
MRWRKDAGRLAKLSGVIGTKDAVCQTQAQPKFKKSTWASTANTNSTGLADLIDKISLET